MLCLSSDHLKVTHAPFLIGGHNLWERSRRRQPRGKLGVQFCFRFRRSRAIGGSSLRLSNSSVCMPPSARLCSTTRLPRRLIKDRGYCHTRRALVLIWIKIVEQLPRAASRHSEAAIYWGPKWLPRGEVIIGEVDGTFILINPRPTLRQLLQSDVNFLNAPSNLAASFVLIASANSSADREMALVSAPGRFGNRTRASCNVAFICDNSYSASGQFLRMPSPNRK
jgi:hypothetical protein